MFRLRLSNDSEAFLAAALCQACNGVLEEKGEDEAVRKEYTTVLVEVPFTSNSSSSSADAGGAAKKDGGREARDELRKTVDRALMRIDPRPDFKRNEIDITFPSLSTDVESSSSSSPFAVVKVRPSPYPVHQLAGVLMMLSPSATSNNENNSKKAKKSQAMTDDHRDRCTSEAQLRRKSFLKRQLTADISAKAVMKKSKFVVSVVGTTDLVREGSIVLPDGWTAATASANAATEDASSTTQQAGEAAAEKQKVIEQSIRAAVMNRHVCHFSIVSTAGVELTLAVVARGSMYDYLAVRTGSGGSNAGSGPLFHVVGKIPTPSTIPPWDDTAKFTGTSKERPATVFAPENAPVLRGGRRVHWFTDPSARTVSVIARRIVLTRSSLKDSSASSDLPLDIELEQVAQSGPLTFQKSAEASPTTIVTAAEVTQFVHAEYASLLEQCVEYKDDPEVKSLIGRMSDTKDVKFTLERSGRGGKSSGSGANALPTCEALWKPSALTQKPAPIGTAVPDDESTVMEYKQHIGKKSGADGAFTDRVTTEKIRQTMSAMASTRGGVILVGVDDDGVVVGMPKGDSLKDGLRMTGFQPAMPKGAVMLHEITTIPTASATTSSSLPSAGSASASAAVTGGGSSNKLPADWWKNPSAISKPSAAKTTTTADTRAEKGIVNIIRIQQGEAPFYTSGKMGTAATQWPMMRGAASTLPMSVHAMVLRVFDQLCRDAVTRSLKKNNTSGRVSSGGSTTSAELDDATSSSQQQHHALGGDGTNMIQEMLMDASRASAQAADSTTKDSYDELLSSLPSDIACPQQMATTTSAATNSSKVGSKKPSTSTPPPSGRGSSAAKSVTASTTTSAKKAVPVPTAAATAAAVIVPVSQLDVLASAKKPSTRRRRAVSVSSSDSGDSDADAGRSTRRQRTE